jgi:hypothetical protein
LLRQIDRLRASFIGFEWGADVATHVPEHIALEVLLLKSRLRNDLSVSD